MRPGAITTSSTVSLPSPSASTAATAPSTASSTPNLSRSSSSIVDLARRIASSSVTAGAAICFAAICFALASLHAPPAAATAFHVARASASVTRPSPSSSRAPIMAARACSVALSRNRRTSNASACSSGVHTPSAHARAYNSRSVAACFALWAMGAAPSHSAMTYSHCCADASKASHCTHRRTIQSMGIRPKLMSVRRAVTRCAQDLSARYRLDTATTKLRRMLTRGGSGSSATIAHLAGAVRSTRIRVATRGAGRVKI